MSLSFSTIKKFLTAYYLEILSFGFVFGYLLFALIIPFVRFNDLVNWDLAGLFFSSWYQHEYLFPRIIGWNPFFFMGYAQHQFYPPLFAYVTAALGFLMPLKAAFKAMFVATLVLLPLSFYYCARSFSFSRAKASVAMLAMFTLLFLFPGKNFGGDMHATFHVGLVTHALGMALFFFYLGALQKNWGSRRFIVPTVLFALIILTHIVAAFAAAFAFIAYLVSKTREKKDWCYPLIHGVLVFLLTAFWTFPFIAKREWMSAFPIAGVSAGWLYLVVIALLALALISPKKALIQPTLFLAIVLLFAFVITYVHPIPIHLYRFFIYVMCMIVLIALGYITTERKLIFGVIAALSIFFVWTSVPVDAGGAPGLMLEGTLSAREGRTLLVTPSYNEATPHLIQHYLPQLTGQHSLRGLYVESSVLPRYIFDVEHELEPGGLVTWGTYVDYALISRNESLLAQIVPVQLNLLGVSRVVLARDTVAPAFFPNSSQTIMFSVDSKKEHAARSYEYRLYDVAVPPLAEIVRVPLRSVEDERWHEATTKWFLSENISKELLTTGEIPHYQLDGGAEVHFIHQSNTQEYLRFFVNASTPVPVLIKVAAFPNWNAYEDGKRIKIYRASPSLMLVFAKGDLAVRYESTPSDRIGNWLSLAGSLLFCGLIYRLIKKKVIKKHP